MSLARSNVFSPIKGLPVIEVINRFELGTGYRLSVSQKYTAVITLDEYFVLDPSPCVSGMLDVLGMHSDCIYFVTLARRVFLPS